MKINKINETNQSAYTRIRVRYIHAKLPTTQAQCYTQTRLCTQNYNQQSQQHQQKSTNQ